MSSTSLNLVEDYLYDMDLAKKTKELRRYLLHTFLLWIDQAGLQHETLTVRQVKAWIESHESWGNSMAVQTSVSIRLFSAWRFKEKSPLANLRLKLEDPGEQRTLTKAEVDRIWAYLDKPVKVSEKGRASSKYSVTERQEAARIRNRAILSLALDTGLRAFELCRLEVKQLYISEQRLQVLGKRKKWRYPVFSEDTACRLREWMAIREKWAKRDCKTVFVTFARNNYTGKPLTTRGLLQTMGKIGKETGMYLTTHTLRRSFATLAIRQGASTRLVQVQGGWSSVEMVERYTRALTPDDFAGYFPSER
jgi:site-specific recombinase XerD